MEPIKMTTTWSLFRRRYFIEADENKITFRRRKFPFFWNWEQTTFDNEKLIFCGNDDDPKKSSILFISEDDKYDELPTNSKNAAADDKDDWLYDSLKDKSLLDDEDDKEDDEDDADLYMCTSTIRLPLASENLEKLYAHLESIKAIKAKVRYASGFLWWKRYLAYTDKWLFHFERKTVDSTPLSEMAFFIKGIGSIYCGYHRQVNAKVLSPSLIKEISDLCYSKAKRLNEQGDTYKIGWIFPDQVTLTPKAIIYTRKTLFKDEMVYLPYKRINMVLSDRKYLFWKRISVFGEQNINLKHLVPASKAAKIEEVLKKHGVDPTKGIPFNSAKIFPSNWFGRAPKIVCMDDCIVYYPNRIGGKELQSCMLKYKDISTITYYKKFLSLFGTVAISGVVDNIRQDQADTYVRMEIPDLFAFKFKWAIFTGRLKRILQDKTDVEIERVRGNN